MKVIDLLNKIANGEEVPKKIETEEDVFVYVPCAYDYKCDNTTIKYWLFRDFVFGSNGNYIDYEVEIIEEEKEIEKMETMYIDHSRISDSNVRYVFERQGAEVKKCKEKINELIDEIKKLKEQIK